MRLSTKLSGIVAVGGVAALGAGLISSGGVGAAFTDSATANATIDVGDFSCTLASSDPALTNLVAQADGTYLADFNLGQIQSSAAGSKSAALAVTNSGDIPIKVTWTATKVNSNLGAKFTPIDVASAVLPNRGDTQNANIGFDWTALNNTDLTHSGTAQYKISCDETGFSLFNREGGTAAWDVAANAAVLDIPQGINGHYPDAAPSAGVKINNADKSLPANPPVFTTEDASSAVGTPRLVIEFGDGSTIWGYQTGDPHTLMWDHAVGYNAPWSSVVTYAQSRTITSVYVVMDSSRDNNNPTTADHSTTLTCVNYTGTPLFGTC